MTSNDTTFTSGTFILPPKPEHGVLVAELEAVATAMADSVQGYPMTPEVAQSILTLYSGLRPDMRDTLFSKAIPAMVESTIRCRTLSKDDRSWGMFSRLPKVG
jgi:hypothetical protein